MPKMDDELLYLITCLEMFDSESCEEKLYYSKNWYDNIENMTENQFYDTFGMSKKCFDSLIRIFSDDNIEDLQLKLRLFLYFLAHKITYRELRNLFGIPKSTVFLYMSEMIDKMCQKAYTYVKFPSENEYLE